MTPARLAALVLCLATSAAAQTPTPPADPPPLRLGPVTFSGYLQADALTVLDDDLEETSDTFRVRRARLGVGGDLAPKLGWAISVEVSGSPHVRDAYMTVRFAPQMHLRFGQFYPALGFERLTSSSRLEVIDRTRLTETITYERNAGVAISNASAWKGWVSYTLGVFNGTGMNRADDNDAKDVVGRLVFTPPALAGLSIGVNAAGGAQPGGDRVRSGVDVSFERAAFKLAVEGLRETMDDAPTRDGYYVLGVYRIRPRTVTPHFRMVELAVRLTQFDDPTSAREPTPTRSLFPASTRELQFGGNYHVNRNVRFLANAIVPVDDRDAPGSTLIGRLQVMF